MFVKACLSVVRTQPTHCSDIGLIELPTVVFHLVTRSTAVKMDMALEIALLDES